MRLEKLMVGVREWFIFIWFFSGGGLLSVLRLFEMVNWFDIVLVISVCVEGIKLFYSVKCLFFMLM